MKPFYFILINLFVGSLFGQNFLPLKDTIITKAGFQIEYKVQEHAIFMTTSKNGKWNGPYKSYYKNGKIWSEGSRINGKIEGKSISYTPSGKIAMIEEWKDSRLVNQVIYYQNTIDQPQRYFFVSKTGFTFIENGKERTLDSTTPDSLIEENFHGAYIWLNGERKLFSGKEAPKYKLIKTGEKSGLYRIDVDNKLTFIRPLTKGEMK